MLELFEFGEFLVKTFERLGDFLLVDPAPVISVISNNVVNFMDAIGLNYGADLIAEYFSKDLTLATFILGPSIVCILIIRLVKFFIDFL